MCLKNKMKMKIEKNREKNREKKIENEAQESIKNKEKNGTYCKKKEGILCEEYKEYSFRKIFYTKTYRKERCNLKIKMKTIKILWFVGNVSNWKNREKTSKFVGKNI